MSQAEPPGSKAAGAMPDSGAGAPAVAGAAGTRALRRRLMALGAVIVLLLALAGAWAWSPMKAWLDLDTIVGALRGFGRSFGVPAAIAGFALAVATAVPLTFLTLVAIVAFGPWGGLACALPGALAGSAISYGVGMALGREALAQLAGPKIQLVSQRLGERGLLAMIAIRLVPVAPFPIVNMVAGATHIRLRDLLLGTAIGMMPSTVFMMVFVDTILASLKKPSGFGVGMLALTVVLVVAGGWALRRWLKRRPD